MAFPEPTTSTQAQSYVIDDPRWARIVARDRTADGRFWFAVITTGVYCRPSCPSRHAKPENVRIYEKPEDARGAGFRPCKRCNPDGISNDAANAALVARTCRMMAESRREIPLALLAEAVDLSPSHFHRIFKATLGVTPKRYAAGLKAQRLRESLDKSATITEAVYDAGFNSSSRFYEKAQAMLGMTPQAYRQGGQNETLHFAIGEVSLGSFLVASSSKGIVSILMGDDPESLLVDLQNRFPRAELLGADANYESLIAYVVGLIDGPQLGLDLPLDIRGTAFQQRVWQALRELPPGSTASYGEIAERIGAPTAVRAVAGACAANNIAVAVPCHRVVRGDGALSGYAWGVERKRALLAKEADT